MKKLFTLLCLCVLCIGSAWGGNYVKVTSQPEDWSGEYLLVYESSTTEGVAWTGVDAANCNTAVTISDGKITSKPDGAVTLTIATMTGGYSIKVNGGTNNGKYIKGTSGSNTLVFDDVAQLNTIEFETEGVKITSSTSVMRYNSASGNNRFRYFKSSSYTNQKAIQLYKYVEKGNTPSISAGDVNLAYDATSGEIIYELVNASGSTMTAAEKVDVDWISNVAVDDANNKVTFSTTANTDNKAREAVITLTYGTLTKDVTVTQAKNNVYTTLADLVKAGAPTTGGETVTVTLTNELITGIYMSGSYRNGVFLRVGDQEIEIYCRDVPTDWVVGGTISGTITCPWKLYSSTWELCPTSWDGLTYVAPTTEYTVTIANNIVNGSVSANPTIAVAGTEIALTATPADGYVFGSWAVTDASSNPVTVTDNKFTMPASNVTVSATFVDPATLPSTFTWDLTKDETATATEDEISWTNDYVSMGDTRKDDKSTAANNYYPGTSGKTYSSTRFYSGSTLTLAPKAGVTISQVVFTATSDSYASALANSTWTNASASATGKVVTVTPNNGTTSISATIGGSCGLTTVAVKYFYTEPQTQDVTITEAGYATAYLPFAATVEGATAYYVTVDGSYAKLNEITGTIPANTGVVLKGEAGTATFTESTATPASVEGNLLIGTAKAEGAAFAEDNTTYYILSTGSNGVGFYWDPTSTAGEKANCAQYKAVLAVSNANGAAPRFISFDEATGIEAIENAESTMQDAQYNLNGVRVNGNYKGIVIINGKKVIK